MTKAIDKAREYIDAARSEHIEIRDTAEGYEVVRTNDAKCPRGRTVAHTVGQWNPYVVIYANLAAGDDVTLVKNACELAKCDYRMKY